MSVFRDETFWAIACEYQGKREWWGGANDLQFRSHPADRYLYGTKAKALAELWSLRDRSTGPATFKLVRVRRTFRTKP